MTSATACRKSADHATRHFRHQRITALVLIPLSVWMLVFLNKALNASYTDTIDWLVSPINAAAVILWIISVFYHAAIGVQVVLEDYVSTIPSRTAAIVASKLVFAVLGVVALAVTIFILYAQG